MTNDADTLRACLDKLIALADLPAQFPSEERARVAEAIEQVSLEPIPVGRLAPRR